MTGAFTLDLLGGVGRRGSAHPLAAPPASQLTIFYSGTVNVYDDVPAEKAQAIMLLLANGDERRNRSSDAKPATAASSLDATANSATASMSRPSATTSTPFRPPFSVSPTLPSSAPQPERKPQLIPKRTQAELPFARKASLARFLEKRKDRVQTKAPVSPEEEAPDGGASKKLKACDTEGKIAE